MPDNSLEGALAAAREYALYQKVKKAVNAEGQITTVSGRVFPNWANAREVADSAERLAELQEALRHHIARSRLANVWVSTERFQKTPGRPLGSHRRRHPNVSRRHAGKPRH